MFSISTRFFVKYFIRKYYTTRVIFTHHRWKHITSIHFCKYNENSLQRILKEREIFFVIENFRNREGFKIEKHFTDIQKQMYFIIIHIYI